MPQPVPGDIVIVDYPFSMPPRAKRRPGLVVFAAGHGDLVIARVTSAAPRMSGDVALRDWQSEGLVFASTVRLLKLATFAGVMVHRVAGRLSEKDSAAIAAALQEQVRQAWN